MNIFWCRWQISNYSGKIGAQENRNRKVSKNEACSYGGGICIAFYPSALFARIGACNLSSAKWQGTRPKKSKEAAEKRIDKTKHYYEMKAFTYIA